MASPILEEHFSIPWARSPRFPNRGRLDYLAGDIAVDMRPEDLYTHGTLKVEITVLLHSFVVQSEKGLVFSDRTRISSPPAELSVEPDVVAVLWQSLDEGRLREIPSAGERPGRYIELEGAPDLVVEIVSDSSAGKDLERLPGLYAAAGVPELWTVDARAKTIRFVIRTLESGRYRILEPEAGGWHLSPFLGLKVRLRRKRVQPDRWVYRLETREG
jgi:Uma2 family endonuclease